MPFLRPLGNCAQVHRASYLLPVPWHGIQGHRLRKGLRCRQLQHLRQGSLHGCLPLGS